MRIAAVLLLALAGCAAPMSDAGLAMKVGQVITISGVAEDAKLGALLTIGPSHTVWIDGIDAWPEPLRGQRVEVTGKLVERDDLPVFVPRAGEPIVQGIPVAEGTDLDKARRRLVITEARYRRID